MLEDRKFGLFAARSILGTALMQFLSSAASSTARMQSRVELHLPQHRDDVLIERLPFLSTLTGRQPLAACSLVQRPS
jgi:hypothetical protein